MGHTREQRDKHALCGARRKNGQKCRKFAGEGTSHPGVGRCKYHLGNAKNHRINAIKLEAQKRALEFGGAIDIDASEALLTVLHLSYGHLQFIRAELTAIADEPSFERDVLLRAWDEERERVARVAKACLDAGVDERRVALAERYAEQLAQFIRGVFWDAELGLTKKQQEHLPVIVRRHLLVLEGGTPALPSGE